jgi:hypothetical protein
MNILEDLSPPSSLTSTLTIEAIHSSEMLATTYNTTWHHSLEDHNLHFHFHKNLKSHIILYYFLEYKFIMMIENNNVSFKVRGEWEI